MTFWYWRMGKMGSEKTELNQISHRKEAPTSTTLSKFCDSSRFGIILEKLLPRRCTYVFQL